MAERRAFRTATLLLLLFLLLELPAGCTSPKAVAPEGVPPELARALPPVPLEIGPHQVSAPYTYELDGRQHSGRSADAEYVDTALRIHPEAGAIGWAIYRLDCVGQPVIQATVEIEVAAGEAYLGLADYGQECWVFGDPVGAGTHVLPLEIAAVSPEDHVYVAVVAMGGSDVTVVRVALTVDQPGWGGHIVDQGSIVGLRVALFVQDSRPMIAYLGPAQGVVSFARATTSFPVSAADWEIMTIDSRVAPAELGPPLAAASIGGRPAAVYVETHEDLLVYARALTAEPSSITDWERTTIYEGSVILEGLSLANLNDTPRIVFHPMSGSVSSAWADTVEPAPADWHISEVVPAGAWASWPMMTVFGGVPVICMHAELGGEKGVHYGRPTSAFPSGPEDWNFSVVSTNDTSGSSGSIAVLPFKPSSRLMICYLSNFWQGPLYFLRAEVSQPSAPTDWTGCQVDTQVRLNDLASVDKRPFLIYHEMYTNTIQCAWAKTILPTGPEDWTYYVIEEGMTETYCTVAAAGIDGTPVIAYRDAVNDALVFAYFDG